MYFTFLLHNAHIIHLRSARYKLSSNVEVIQLTISFSYTPHVENKIDFNNLLLCILNIPISYSIRYLYSIYIPIETLYHLYLECLADRPNLNMCSVYISLVIYNSFSLEDIYGVLYILSLGYNRYVYIYSALAYYI